MGITEHRTARQMILSTNQRAFHVEEYKQLRSEVIGLLTRIEQLFRYSIVVAASVSAWLVSNSLGLTGTSSTVCLKLPQILLMVGWLIPPVFVAGAGLMAAVTARRVREMGAYLRKLEEVLGHRELGWEAHLTDQKTILTPTTERLWYAVFVLTTTAALVALQLSYTTAVACPK